jgi:hypothetical protein
MTYTYVDKLEKLGCACSESQYRSYIKSYSIFLIIYLFATMLMPASAIADMFGDVGTYAYMVIRPLVSVATIVFIVLTVMYLRDLVNKKCQCSEDIRREVLYIYYIIEVILISFAVLYGLMEIVVLGALGTSLNAVKKLASSDVIDNLRNPVKHMKSLPKDLKGFPKRVSDTLKKTMSKK